MVVKRLTSTSASTISYTPTSSKPFLHRALLSDFSRKLAADSELRCLGINAPEDPAGDDLQVPAGVKLPPRPSNKGPLAPPEVPEPARVTALTVIPFGFGNTHVAIIVQQRAAFVQELVSSRIQIKKDHRQEIHGFTLEEAHRMANSIYHELLGLPAVKHVATIIKEYTSANAGGIDASAS